MRFTRVFSTGACALALSLWAQVQTPTAAPSAPPAALEVKGMPPRGKPTDYPTQARVGPMTVGAEFMRHAVTTPQGTFSSEEYVVVEAGFYGAPGTRTTLSVDEFALSINGKKAVPSVIYGRVLESVKDPEWIPPEPPSKKGGGLSTGDNSNSSDPPPPAPKMPLPLVREMNQKIQRAALPDGDRALPQAGLLFFPYRGNVKSIKSVELVYNGPAGKATLKLEP